MGSSAIIQAFKLGAQCRSMLTKARYRYQYPMMACMLMPGLVLLDWVEQVCDAKTTVVVIIKNALTNMRRSMRPIHMKFCEWLSLVSTTRMYSNDVRERRSKDGTSSSFARISWKERQIASPSSQQLDATSQASHQVQCTTARPILDQLYSNNHTLIQSEAYAIRNQRQQCNSPQRSTTLPTNSHTMSEGMVPPPPQSFHFSQEERQRLVDRVMQGIRNMSK